MTVLDQTEWKLDTGTLPLGTVTAPAVTAVYVETNRLWSLSAASSSWQTTSWLPGRV